MRHDLVTEQSNPLSSGIDALSTEEMLLVINDADAEIAAAVRREVPHIALAVDGIAHRLRGGGRLFYTGAGTSGRLGVLDASECPPTFNTPPEMVQGLIAGGDHALRHSVERAEDDPFEAGKEDLRRVAFQPAPMRWSGSPPAGARLTCWAASRMRAQLGALTIGLSCTTDSEVAAAAEIAITPAPGPEVITGSTRMRAGTATKLVLNMISTGVMIRLGYVYGNLMVNVQPTNEKLTDRARRIIASHCGRVL